MIVFLTQNGNKPCYDPESQRFNDIESKKPSHVAISVSTRTKEASTSPLRSWRHTTSNATTSIAKDVHAIDSPLLKASFRHRKRSRQSSLPSQDDGIDATTYALPAYVCHRSRLDRYKQSNWHCCHSIIVPDHSHRYGSHFWSSHRTNDLVIEEAANSHRSPSFTSTGASSRLIDQPPH